MTVTTVNPTAAHMVLDDRTIVGNDNQLPIKGVAGAEPVPMSLIDPETGNPLGLDDVATVTGSPTDPNRFRLFCNSGSMARPNNTDAYSVNDAISNSNTANQVTSNSIELADANDTPVMLVGGKLVTNDSGFATALANMEIIIFNSDPTANNGVVGANAETYSNKGAGYVTRLTGTFKPATGYFSDLYICDLSIAPGERSITPTAIGTKVLFWQPKTLSIVNPAAGETTLALTLFGVQGRA